VTIDQNFEVLQILQLAEVPRPCQGLCWNERNQCLQRLEQDRKESQGTETSGRDIDELNAVAHGSTVLLPTQS